jgi:Icc-related predicted phosphoesterase
MSDRPAGGRRGKAGGTMLLYAAADIHGRRERLACIRRHLQDHPVDLLVLAGDLTGLRGAEALIASLGRMPVPVLAVRGNSDRRQVDSLLEDHPNTQSLHLRRRVCGGVPFVGVSGTLPLPFFSRLRWRERQTLTTLATWIDATTVVVVHPPPRGVRDAVFGFGRAGSTNLRRFVMQHQPRLLLCGHIHEQAGTAAIGRTTVVNCAMGRRCAGALIWLNADGPPEVQLLAPR